MLSRPNEVAISAFGRSTDGAERLDAVHTEMDRLRSAGARVGELGIDPLAAGWSTPPTANSFRSGAAPAFAVREAHRRIASDQVDAVLIVGRDDLRSGYDSAARRAAMDVYGGISIPAASARSRTTRQPGRPSP